MSLLSAVLKLYCGRAVSSPVNNKAKPQAATAESPGDLSNSFRHRVVNLPTRFVVISVHEDVYFGLGTLHPSVQTDLTTRPGKDRTGKNLIAPRRSTSHNRELFQSRCRSHWRESRFDMFAFYFIAQLTDTIYIGLPILGFRFVEK